MELLIPDVIQGSLRDNLAAYGLKGCRLKAGLDKCVWFISNLVREKDRNGHTLREFTGLNNAIVQKYLGNSWQKEVREPLLDAQIITVNEKYSNRGKFSKSYTLNPERFKGDISEYRITTPSLLNKYKTTPTLPSFDEPFLGQVFSSLTPYGIDYGVYRFLGDAYRSGELKPMQYMAYYLRAKEIDFRDMYVIRDETGRVYSNFTNLPKIMRPFITQNGKPMVTNEVDVSACMAFVLGALMERGGIEGQDVDLFIKMAQEPDFYAGMAAHTGYYPERYKKDFLAMLNEENRNKVKRPIYRSFRKAFPTVAKFINDTNRKDNATLYRLCVAMESRVMIGMVYNRLLAGNIPAFSIHDGILTTPQHVKLVEKLIRKGFREEFGRVPVIKVK